MLVMRIPLGLGENFAAGTCPMTKTNFFDSSTKLLRCPVLSLGLMLFSSDAPANPHGTFPSSILTKTTRHPVMVSNPHIAGRNVVSISQCKDLCHSCVFDIQRKELSPREWAGLHSVGTVHVGFH